LKNAANINDKVSMSNEDENRNTEARQESGHEEIDSLVMASRELPLSMSADKSLREHDESMILQIMEGQSEATPNEVKEGDVKIVKHSMKATIERSKDQNHNVKSAAEVYSPAVQNFGNPNLSFSGGLVHYVPRPAKI
jgi:hypothetical protein